MRTEQRTTFWERTIIVMLVLLFIVPPGLAQTLRNHGGRPVKLSLIHISEPTRPY